MTMLLKSRDGSSSPTNGSPKARGTGTSPKQAGPKRPKLPLQYFFTLNCNLNSTQPPPIEVPGGVRVHLGYLAEGSSVASKDELFQPSWDKPANPRLADVSDADRKAVEALLEDKSRVGIVQLLDGLAKKYGKELSSKQLEGPGISGKVLSGGDTLLVRSDGVVVFDGRATIEEEKGFLIDVCASGVVDLRNAVPAGRSGQEAFEAYCAGGDSNAATTGSIPVKLSIRFEASQGAGAAAEFAAKRYVLNSLNHWKFEPLVRGQFVGIGKVHVKPGRYWPAEKIELDVYRLGSLP
jgi:hypothetical protein